MRFGVIVPAAGEGQRLRPHTLRSPKVMLEVAGKPIIGHIFDRLVALAPERVCVVVPPGEQRIERYLRENFPSLSMSFVVQPEPRGLGDAVRWARPVLEGLPVLIVLGDTIIDTDYRALFQGEAAIGVKPVADPRRFGVVFLENGMVRKIVEKPAQPVSNLAIVGIYYFSDSHRMFQAMESVIQSGRMVRGEYQFTDALQILADSGIGIRAVTVEGWLDCGTPEALLETNRLLLAKYKDGAPGCTPPVAGGFIIPPVWVAPDAVIERSVLGPYVAVSARARITECVLSNALVYRGAVVERAVITSGIVGEGARVRGGAGFLNIGPDEERTFKTE